MTEQLDLLGGARPVDKPVLTDRQQYAYDQVAGQPDGLASDEVGAMLHERRGKHDAGVRCQFCSREGLDVLKALRRKRLVIRRKTGMWQTLDKRAPSAAPGGYDPTTAPWPEGF